MTSLSYLDFFLHLKKQEIVSGCKGVVRRYVPNQGWGFIRNEFLGDKDVFFHANHFRSPVPEQPVHPEDGDDKTINVLFECDWKSDDKPKAFKVLVFDKESGQLAAPVPGQVNKYGFGNGGTPAARGSLLKASNLRGELIEEVVDHGLHRILIRAGELIVGGQVDARHLPLRLLVGLCGGGGVRG